MRPAVPPLMSQTGHPVNTVRGPVPGGGQAGGPGSLMSQPPGSFQAPPFDPRAVMPNIRNPLLPVMQVGSCRKHLVFLWGRGSASCSFKI